MGKATQEPINGRCPYFVPPYFVPSCSKVFIDGTDATNLADRAGFPLRSIIYLDIETGDAPSKAMKDYYSCWVQQIIAEDMYRPGVYCSHNVAKSLYEEDDCPAFWVWNVKDRAKKVKYKVPFPAREPLFSEIPFATMWQYVHKMSQSRFPMGRFLREWT